MAVLISEVEVVMVFVFSVSHPFSPVAQFYTKLLGIFLNYL